MGVLCVNPDVVDVDIGYGSFFRGDVLCDEHKFLYGRFNSVGDRERRDEIMLGDVKAFLHCFTLAPRFGEKRILAKVVDGDLLIRPNDLTAFKVILAENNLMTNPSVMAVMNWFATSKDRWLTFRK